MTEFVPRISSALRSVEIRQEPAPLIIGERLNTQGSRRAKRLVLAGDLDGLADLGRTQAEDGAHCLDVCVATTELADETGLMVRLVKRLSLEVEAPLVIDSTDPDVIEAAVRQIPGRPMINSINLEGDGSRFHRLAPLMARYGLPAIALCIGPDGMAKTPQEKLGTARLLLETGKMYGLKPGQFVFDVLTFTLATGEAEFLDAGRNTLEGIRLVKEGIPGSFTVLGLSNISFGLAPHARRVLNSVFLYHAVRAGLDCAIVNAREIVPYGEVDSAERKLAEDLIFNRSPDALSSLVSHFEGTDPKAGPAKREEIDPSWDAGRRSNFRIVNRLREGIEDDVVSAIAEKIPDCAAQRHGERLAIDLPKEATHDAAVRTLNSDLLPAMKEVGDKFGSGELILPFVLRSAECMKAAVAEMEKYLLRREGASKGRLVLGTVYGDVHDIGKNLVKTIFENNGYDVYDLGKQVPMQRFLEEIERVRPDAVGLSALLVSTSKQMGMFVDHARSSSMSLPVLCGGAAINTNFINRIAKEGGIYGGGVFYCGTMFDGLKVMDGLVGDGRQELLSRWRERLEAWQEGAAPRAAEGPLPRSSVVPVKPPVPPHVGVPVQLSGSEIPMDEVWPLLDRRALFKMSWGLRGKAGSESEAEHEKLLEELQGRVFREGLFEPQVVYGYFRCRARGERLEVKYPGGTVTLDFPRSTRPRHLCISDYFGGDDIVAFQSVTVGRKVSQVAAEWDADGRYADSLYLQGLAVQTAEALAEWANRRIISELNLERGGLRYSWGYASCPDVSQHFEVWKLLEPQRSGMTLTEAGQIDPEQSTAAIVLHHPDAEYFTL